MLGFSKLLVSLVILGPPPQGFPGSTNSLRSDFTTRQVSSLQKGKEEVWGGLLTIWLPGLFCIVWVNFSLLAQVLLCLCSYLYLTLSAG